MNGTGNQDGAAVTGGGGETGGDVDEAFAIATSDPTANPGLEAEPAGEDGSGQPAPEPAPKTGDEAPAAKPTDGEAGAAPADDPEKATAEEAEKIANEFLGISTGESETLESLTSKYQKVFADHEQLSARVRSQLAALESIGVQLVEKEDGTFGLAATPKYANEIGLEKIRFDANSVYDSLTDQEKTLLATDEKSAVAAISRKVAGQVAAAMAAVRPPVNALREDAVLPAQEQIETAQRFIEMKTSDGKAPLYPDAAGKVMQTMSRIFNTPGKEAADFRRFAYQSKQHLHFAMDLLYGKVFRANAAAKAIMEDRKRAAQEAGEHNKKAPVAGPSGHAPMAGRGQMSEAEAIARAQ